MAARRFNAAEVGREIDIDSKAVPLVDNTR